MTIYLRPKSASPRDFPDSLGHLLGRTTVYNDAGSISNAIGIAGAAILPEVVEWPPYTVGPNDTNDIPYPLGLVGVKIAKTFGVPVDPGTTSNSVPYYPIPVPTVLPAGYDHRWRRDHMWLPGTDDPSTGQGVLAEAEHDFTGVSATSVSHRIRMADGLHDYFYVPECRRNGYDSGFNGQAGSAWSHVPITGWRYIWFEYQWETGRGWEVFYTPPPHLVIEIRCNADGSKSSPLNGDTLLASWDTGPATDGGAIVVSPHYTSLQFPLGIRRWVQIRTILYDYPHAGDVRENWASIAPFRGIRTRAGARVDLPLHFTATGAGGLIAPGGIVTSSLDQPLP